MALTDVELCSRALTRLGAKAIQSFTDGSDISTACSLTYTSLLESELSLYPWRFAMKKAVLSRNNDTPTGEWKYSYQLPTDRIGAPFAVFSSIAVGARPMQSYEIFADKVFTNSIVVAIDYPFKPSESSFPSYFSEFLVLALAANLAMPVTDQNNTAQFYNNLAYGTPSEAGTGGALSRARHADSVQQPQGRIESFELVDARF